MMFAQNVAFCYDILFVEGQAVCAKCYVCDVHMMF